MREVSTPSSTSTARAASGTCFRTTCPAKSTVYDHFAQWRDDGTWQTMMDALAEGPRSRRTRARPVPGASTARRSRGPRSAASGATRGQEIRGVKRHIVVDSLGLLLVVMVSAASADDGRSPRGAGPIDGGASQPAGERFGPTASITIITSTDGWPRTKFLLWESRLSVGLLGSVGVYVPLHRRWVVERTLAGLGRYRRNSRHYEWHACSGESMLRISSIHRMLRFLKPDTTKPPNPFKYRELQENVIG